MKKLNKKIIIIFGILLVSILIGAIGYKNYNKNKFIHELNTYLDKYKQETSTYDLTNNKEEYENLIEQYEQAIVNKDYKSMEVLKQNLEDLKHKLLEINLEMSNKAINELESIDISILDNKESILSKIEDIKLLIEQHQFIKANEDVKVLKNEVTTNLEDVKKNRIESIYKKLDGYWIGNLDIHTNVRIDLRNNTITESYIESGGFYPTIDNWRYDEKNDLYELICSYKTDNPFMPIGESIVYKIKFINYNEIELYNKKLYKVSYEQAIYYQLYWDLTYEGNPFSIVPGFKLNLLSSYTKNSEYSTNVISDEKAREIILDKVYSRELIEYNKKAANAFEINLDLNSQVATSEFQLAPNIKYYYFDALSLKLPYDYKDGTILGDGYFNQYCFASGMVLPNGIVITTSDQSKSLESLKNEILTYYN